MKFKIFEYLLKRREELSEEALQLYFRLYPSGRLTVGFEYEYIEMWLGKPSKRKERICSKYINFDNLTEKKVSDFISNLEEQINEIQTKRKKSKEETSYYIMEMKMTLSSIKI